MASISTPTPPRLSFPNSKFNCLLPLRRPYYPSPSLPFPSHSHSLCADATAAATVCRCLNPASDSPSPSDDSAKGWDSVIQDVMKGVVKSFDSFINSLRDESQHARNSSGVAEADNKREENVEFEDEEWDWDRWGKHFQEVDEQERLVSILKVRIKKDFFYSICFV